MPNKIISDLVNKGAFGAVWLGFVAVVTLIASAVGLQLTVNIGELGNAISNGSILSALIWVGSTLVFAFIAVYLTKYSIVFKILGRKETDKVVMPKRIGILTLLVLGGLISIAIMVLNWFLSTIGAGSAEIPQLVETFTSGNIWGIVVATLSIIVVGYLVFGIASFTEKLQKTLHKSEFTKRIPDGSRD